MKASNAASRRMARASFVVALVVTSSAAFTIGKRTLAADDPAFPHAAHARLFPTCSGCHAGIATGDSTAMFPPASACVACHNGRDARPVAWARRTPHPTNLRFDHVRHALGGDSTSARLSCESCHGANGTTSTWMAIERARPETCISCHAHPAPSHLAPASPCATCHVPLARAVALSDSAIATFPKPPSHAAADFLETHGSAAMQASASCATCHSRESCARCHLNAATLPATAKLEPDPRIARLVRGRPASYTTPASHRRSDFLTVHGSLARGNLQTCATCHAQPSCRSCHTGSSEARTIAALPPGGPGAVGVVFTPSRVHAASFVQTHGSTAASARLTCAGCHQERFCTSCHQGNGQRRYHPFDFVARHASEAFAREVTCTSCHNTEVFCRSCHRQVAGIGANSQRRSGTAHASQPEWLLQHGEAARRGMQSCASCHQQTDCMQCHSSLTGRINPHGPAFDADRMEKKNPSLCAYCHVGKPR